MLTEADREKIPRGIAETRLPQMMTHDRAYRALASAYARRVG
jgi:hypothetical protein